MFNDRLDNSVVGTGSEKHVNFRETTDDLFAKPLRETARDDHSAASTMGLMPGQCENGIDGLVDSRFDKAAGVDYNHFRLGRVLRCFIPGSKQSTRHGFAVNKITCTTEAGNMKNHPEIF